MKTNSFAMASALFTLLDTLLASRRASVPRLKGTQTLFCLKAPVVVESDRFGIPVISASSRLDAISALGYVTARDRLFQMELLRRLSGGRLAEIFGQKAVESDRAQRMLGFSRTAKAIAAHLPSDQKETLQVYSEGVNDFIRQARTLPPEFFALRLKPERWTIEDSLLIALYLFQVLTKGAEDDERMLTIMERVLPPDVVSFLTPDMDEYSTVLLGGASSQRPTMRVPVKSLATLLRRAVKYQAQEEDIIASDSTNAGSNGWVVGKTRTADGRAILACDMHLPLAVPNIWYRAQMKYEDIEITGLVLPGIPNVAVGSNRHIAWGLTGISGDFLDLVILELNPENPDEYKSPNGWMRFEHTEEHIRVKGAQDESVPVLRTIWGPVAERPLLGKPVAIRWTALDHAAVDFRLINLDKARSVEEGLNIFRHAGGPHLNVMLADSFGRIGWTLCGRVPRRKGLDGSTSRSWANGELGWDGYVLSEELPTVIDPSSGILVTANNRTIGTEYPHVIGHNFTSGFRAYQIDRSLREMEAITEKDMAKLQLDTTSTFYNFYQDLALEILTEEVIAHNPSLLGLRMVIERWQGKVDAECLGIGVLIRFREQLLQDVFAPIVILCKEASKDFKYSWKNADTPLRLLLTTRSPQLIPDPMRYSTWEEFILGTFLKSVQQLQSEFPRVDVAQLRWGEINKAAICHPLSRALGWLGRIVDMPRSWQPGCRFCIRVAEPSAGATMRMVVSPGHETEGFMHMPCGQSGHPLSRHYRDQHRFWSDGIPMPYLPGPAKYVLKLAPVLDPIM